MLLLSISADEEQAEGLSCHIKDAADVQVSSKTAGHTWQVFRSVSSTCMNTARSVYMLNESNLKTRYVRGS
jgi:hypothetical protein